MRSILRGAVIVLTSWVVSTGWATDRYVAINNPSPAAPYTDWTTAATNIQTAINAASAGDTIWVGPGRYTVWTNSLIWNSSTNVIYFYNKSLAVRSSDGPATTIIDGEGKYRGVFMGAGAANQSYVLDGFTITNCVVQAYGSGGGGVVIYSPGGTVGSTNTVQNCVVSDCRSTDYQYNCAGGIFVSWVWNPNQPLGVIVSNCVIRNCSTNGFCQTGYSTNADARTIIVDCTVVNNRGSGLWMTGGNFPEYAMIKNCLITDNTTPGSGGGIYIGRPVDIYNCVIARNGCYSDWGTNVASYSGGGGVYIDQASSTATFYNCTIVSNWAGARGFAGVMAHSNASPEWVYFYNTIVYSNWNAWYGQNNIGGSAVKYYINSMTPGVTGAGNISTPAPVFENIAGGDYRLTRFSSGVDAGVVQDWMTGAKDAGGQPRVSGNGLVDMGAYETEVGAHPGYYVAKDGQTPMYPYTNWTMAASNIQDAIDVYNPNYPATVWVKPGRYTAGSNAKVNAGTNSVVDFYNKALALRGFSGNPADTIIDGEGTNRCVFFGPYNVSPLCAYVLDGFTLTNGYAAGNNLARCAGLYIWNESIAPAWTAAVQNCVITDNRTVDPAGDSKGTAGGIYIGYALNYNQNFKFSVSNCVVRNNSTNGFCYLGACTNVNSAITVTDSHFENNMGVGFIMSGGTHWNTIRNSRFVGNTAYSYGGGAYFGTPVVNCLFASNRCLLAATTTGGGAMYLACPTNNARWPWVQGCNLVNCTIVDNFTTNTGYAIYQHWNDNNCVTLFNTIVWSNRNSSGLANHYLDRSSGADVFWTNCLSTALTGTGNLTAPPPAFENQAAGDYRLKRYSAGVDAGTNNLWITGSTDLNGQPRVGGVVDMGAYETTPEAHPGYYVARNGQIPVSPYTNITMAASNIQDAVNVYDVNYPSTVWVGPGRYTRPPNGMDFIGPNVVYIDRPLSLRASSGNSADTIIDGEGVNRGIAWNYRSASTNLFLVDSLTISNCFATNSGGGILFYTVTAAPWTGQVWNCVIVTNTVMYGDAGSAMFEGYAAGYQGSRGGGIGMYANSCGWGLAVTNTVIKDNRALYYKDAVMTNLSYGGGVFIRGTGRVLFEGSTIENNQASEGGGINLTYGGTFRNCKVRYNVADVLDSGSSAYNANGGGISAGGGIVLYNCLIQQNRGYRAGGLFSSAGDNYIYNSTVVSNKGGAGGMQCRFVLGNGTYLQVVNSIFSNDVPNIDMDGPTNRVPDQRITLVMSNSCVKTNGMSLLSYFDLAAPAKGNVTTGEPRFVNYVAGDYRLRFGSPCINTGSNQAWMDGALDLDGNPRISPIKNGVVDMGVYEFPIQVGSVFTLR